LALRVARPPIIKILRFLAVTLWLLGSVFAALAVVYLLVALGSHGNLADGWPWVAIPAALALISFVCAARLRRDR
jgi:hypothetical protein